MNDKAGMNLRSWTSLVTGEYNEIMQQIFQ